MTPTLFRFRNFRLAAALSLSLGLGHFASALPSIQSIEVSPNPLTTGQNFTIAVVASPDVTKAAAVVASRAVALAEEHGSAFALWPARRIYGMALAAAGRHDAAERELRGVVEATRTAGAQPELVAALSAWARVRRTLGDPTGAADALDELRDVAARLGEAGATVA